MIKENPYLSLLEKNTDEELFEILENPDDKDELIFEAAVVIAQKRELISEYQATGLLEGDPTVMDYNPNNLDKQELSYTDVNKPQKDIIPRDVKFKRYGAYMVVLGVLGIYLTYLVEDWHFQLFNYIDYTLSGLAIVGGIAFMIRGVMIKRKRSNEQPFIS